LSEISRSQHAFFFHNANEYFRMRAHSSTRRGSLIVTTDELPMCLNMAQSYRVRIF